MIELEKTGSINKAAANLFISQQGLRKVIDTLEAEMGIKLLERSHSGVRLTPAGKAFAKRAKTISREYSHLKREIADLKAESGDTHTIEMAVAPYASMNLLGHVFSAVDSSARVRIAEANNAEIKQMLRMRGPHQLFLFDWLAFEDGAPHDEMALEGVHVEELFDSRLGLLCNLDSKLAGRSSVSVDEAVALPLATFGGSDYLAFINEALGRDISSSVALRISESNTIGAFVRSTPNAGIILDELSYRNSTLAGAEETAFIPLELNLVLKVGFMHFDNDPAQPLYERYVSDFRKACIKRYRALRK